MKINNKIDQSFLISLWIALGCAASVSRAEIPGAFADIGFGARPMGMGGAYTALASDPYGVLFNPACLPDARGWQISTLHTKQFNLIPYQLASATRNIGNRLGIGAAFLTSGDEALKENTVLFAAGFKLGGRESAWNRLSLGAAFKWRSASFGQNADGGEYRIKGSASGFGLDLGMRIKISPQWTAGVQVRDLWNRMHYDNNTMNKKYNEAVPASLILGTAYMPRTNLVFALDADKALYTDVPNKLMTGMEWRLLKMLFIRAGLSESFGDDLGRKWNLGFGLQHFRKGVGARFDFAYQFHFLANTPRISMSLWF